MRLPCLASVHLRTGKCYPALLVGCYRHAADHRESALVGIVVPLFDDEHAAAFGVVADEVDRIRLFAPGSPRNRRIGLDDSHRSRRVERGPWGRAHPVPMRISSQHQVDPGFSEFDEGPATANGELRDTGSGNCPWRVVHGDDVHSAGLED